jgi:hypothetical protein
MPARGGGDVTEDIHTPPTKRRDLSWLAELFIFGLAGLSFHFWMQNIWAGLSLFFVLMSLGILVDSFVDGLKE